MTKGQVLSAIAAGAAADVPGLKACTRAGTGCGSCVPTLKQLLTAAGVVQPKALCEHFGASRAELFEITAASGIRTFSELISRYGRGRGCDICKPAVASILASLHTGDHILDGERAALQDTNDRHLANMQRNGTYSVVPRIPGGEITPAKLKIIAEVAEEFGLYTKITGGQRIDLFGARLEQLPAIWKRLTDAGFESGHAYGKALRTVKSCVGDTWCRYGVQDSVGLAIELELRYRGLRAPHKIKGGVSGCARECAEARSKDFGVIATENGWNLYVGGNGGFRPRHAELLVSDVSREELIKILDRFLMFYIRTADRLQRTAAWIEAMDGGLSHLRDVVVDDRLGICASLEEAMARHIAGYSDEWRAVLEDPARLAKFASFANAPGTPDSAIEFTVERGQRLLIMGLNGAGKTSLLRILAGVTAASDGSFRLGVGVSVGYYAQEHEGIEAGVSVLEHMRSASGPAVPDVQLRALLGMFGLTGDVAHQDAGTLSGGEKTKLALAQLVAGQHNLLLLDEPTNNLDPPSRASIGTALADWPGAMVLVSHDTGFVAELAPDEVLLMPDGTLDSWDDDFLELVSMA